MLVVLVNFPFSRVKLLILFVALHTRLITVQCVNIQVCLKIAGAIAFQIEGFLDQCGAF